MDRRAFLSAALANGALAAVAPAAFAAPPLEGGVTRLSDKAVRLEWNAKTQPASVFVSSDPAAPRAFMREMKAAGRGAVELPLATSPRPYLLVTTPGGGQTRVAERLLPLKGGRNFRDLGGYRAADGRQVRWGRIYRSGVMAGLTAEDMGYLSDLGVQVICDLRSHQERQSEPNPFLKVDGPRVIATDYDMMSMAGFQKATNRAEAIDAFSEAYLQFSEVLAPQYADMFASLVRREAPLAFNCSAGKDRTGVGAALVLSVLGVPRETVIPDYALTQVYTPPSLYLKQMAASNAGGAPVSGLSSQQAQAFSRMPREVLEVMMGSDPAVMRKTLAMFDQKFGGPVELAKARYGLTDAKIAQLRATYLI